MLKAALYVTPMRSEEQEMQRLLTRPALISHLS